MNYKGYELAEEENRVIIKEVRDFNPVHIFECGQCFRWNRQADGSYTGVAMGRVINVGMAGDDVVLTNSTIQDFINIWFDYFDLGRDYGQIKALLSKDPVMEKAINFGYGIRLLRQDIWETLISFITSANNMIPRIMKTVEAMSRAYGDEIVYNGDIYYTFPHAASLSDLSADKLSFCGGGFRCKYMVESARMVKGREVVLEDLRRMDTKSARDKLMQLPGVGPKVADCVLLFSGTKDDVFPTDVWVKRIMEELYFKREASFREIREFAETCFDGLSGIAQQYLFYYARENRIGA